MPKKAIANVFVFAVVIVAIIFTGVLVFCDAKSHQEDSKVAVNKSDTSPSTYKPLIIWWGRLQDDPEILRLAISSGVFSHVMIRGLNEFDRPSYYADPRLKEAIELCKKRNVRIIWSRWLYPAHKLRGFTLKDAFDSQYYIERIRNIRAEGRRMGIDLVSFDAEPYVNCPLNVFPNRKLPESQFNTLQNAIKIAIKTVGKVDFVLPAAMSQPHCLYNATQHLGKLIINEHTYFDVPERLNHAKQNEGEVPYDIFGACVSITKENKGSAKEPYFTPKEILERQYLWADKGLFIYPGEAQNAAAVAYEFSKIRTIRPAKQ